MVVVHGDLLGVHECPMRLLHVHYGPNFPLLASPLSRPASISTQCRPLCIYHAAVPVDTHITYLGCNPGPVVASWHLSWFPDSRAIVEERAIQPYPQFTRQDQDETRYRLASLTVPRASPFALFSQRGRPVDSAASLRPNIK